MILQKLFSRIPFILYSILYILSKFMNKNNLIHNEMCIYGIEFIVGILQYYNEIEWLIYN